MRAFGARGCVSDAQLKRSAKQVHRFRRQLRDQARDQIAALSNRDIQVMMAEAIVDAAAKRGAVTARDFDQAGLPLHRLDKNKDAAMRLARRKCPRLDAMLHAQVSA